MSQQTETFVPVVFGDKGYGKESLKRLQRDIRNLAPDQKTQYREVLRILSEIEGEGSNKQKASVTSSMDNHHTSSIILCCLS